LRVVDKLLGILEVVLAEHFFEAALVELLIKNVSMLIVNVLMDELCRFEFLVAILNEALVNLSILQVLCLQLCIVLLHVPQNIIILRGRSLTGSNKNTLICCSHVLVFKVLGSRPLRFMLDHALSDFASVSEVLRTALSSKGPFIIILFPAVETVRMNSPEVQKKQIQVLLLIQEVLGIFLDLFVDLWLDLSFLVIDLCNKSFAHIQISINAVLRELWRDHNVLSVAGVQNWGESEGVSRICLNGELFQSFLGSSAILIRIKTYPSVSFEILSLKWLTHGKRHKSRGVLFDNLDQLLPTNVSRDRTKIESH
jgi:hypothetical protein